MPVSSEYLDYILGQLNSLGNITHRRMFGGVGIYQAGTFFAIISEDLLYFKVDDVNRGDYLETDMEPFRPFGDEGGSMQYYEVPESVLTDTEDLREWALKAIDVAIRAAKKKKKKKR